jgi:hypothetical protein
MFPAFFIYSFTLLTPGISGAHGLSSVRGLLIVRPLGAVVSEQSAVITFLLVVTAERPVTRPSALEAPVDRTLHEGRPTGLVPQTPQSAASPEQREGQRSEGQFSILRSHHVQNQRKPRES